MEELIRSAIKEPQHRNIYVIQKLARQEYFSKTTICGVDLLLYKNFHVVNHISVSWHGDLDYLVIIRCMDKRDYSELI